MHLGFADGAVGRASVKQHFRISAAADRLRQSHWFDVSRDYAYKTGTSSSRCHAILYNLRSIILCSDCSVQLRTGLPECLTRGSPNVVVWFANSFPLAGHQLFDVFLLIVSAVSRHTLLMTSCACRATVLNARRRQFLSLGRLVHPSSPPQVLFLPGVLGTC